MVQKAVILALALALGGCSAALSPEAFEATAPEMRPEVFFAGSTSSSGILENRSGAPTRQFHVIGRGQSLPDGTFQLTQIVSFEHEAPRTRTWLLRRLDAHHYSATLTDATGPVHGEAYGDLFHLIYPMASPPGGRMEQWLYLQPDSRTVVNEATVSLLGVTAAHLSERITHEEDVPPSVDRAAPQGFQPP